MDRGIKGDYEGAIAVFSELIEKFPQYDEAYFNRAIAWEKLQQWGRALQDYNQALLHNPQLAEAYHQRGLLWLRWGDPRQAQGDFHRAEELYRQQGNVSGLAGLLPHLPPAAQSSP
jgi:tetratricopeptide (TPR) repeat protein